MMGDATKQAILSVVRSLLIVAGYWLASHGYIGGGAPMPGVGYEDYPSAYTGAGMLDQIVGAIMVLISALWGVWDKYRAERAAKAREAVAVNVGIAVSNAEIGLTAPLPAAAVPEVIKVVALQLDPVAPVKAK